MNHFILCNGTPTANPTLWETHLRDFSTCPYGGISAVLYNNCSGLRVTAYIPAAPPIVRYIAAYPTLQTLVIVTAIGLICYGFNKICASIEPKARALYTWQRRKTGRRNSA